MSFSYLLEVILFSLPITLAIELILMLYVVFGWDPDDPIPPSKRLSDLNNVFIDKSEVHWRNDLRAIPKLIKMHKKLLIISTGCVFVLSAVVHIIFIREGGLFLEYRDVIREGSKFIR